MGGGFLKYRSSRQSKAKSFDKKTRENIAVRDGGCIFCRSGSWQGGDAFDRGIFDTVHIINRSQGGLGIETNGVRGCRYHHSLLDNGNKGYREAMLAYAKGYLKRIYPDWKEEDQIYNKYA